MKFPAIIVERPHQRPGTAWVAESEDDITRQLHECKYGDNWGWRKWASFAEWIDCYGEDREDWPDDTQGFSAVDFPLIEDYGSWGVTYGPEDKMNSELDAALNYIGHDLHALDVLESGEEAEALITRGGHNVPYGNIRECLEELDWTSDLTCHPN